MLRLSVVIPTYRRHRSLAMALDRLERQRVADGSFEVIVVDDPVDDDPPRIARAIGQRPFEVRQLSRQATGVAAARNRGWRDARAPVVLFFRTTC